MASGPTGKGSTSGGRKEPPRSTRKRNEQGAALRLLRHIRPYQGLNEYVDRYLAPALGRWNVLGPERRFLVAPAIRGFLRDAAGDWVRLVKAGLAPGQALLVLLYREGGGPGYSLVLSKPLVPYLRRANLADLADLVEALDEDRRAHLAPYGVAAHRAIAVNQWKPLLRDADKVREGFGESHTPGDWERALSGFTVPRPGWYDGPFNWERIADLQFGWDAQVPLEPMVQVPAYVTPAARRLLRRAGLGARWQRAMEVWLWTGSADVFWLAAMRGPQVVIGADPIAARHWQGLPVAFDSIGFHRPGYSGKEDSDLRRDLENAVAMASGCIEPESDQPRTDTLTMFRDLRILELRRVGQVFEKQDDGEFLKVARTGLSRAKIVERVNAELRTAGRFGYIDADRLRDLDDIDDSGRGNLCVDESTVASVLSRWDISYRKQAPYLPSSLPGPVWEPTKTGLKEILEGSV